MVVLQFAWGGGTNNVHLPHMHYENSFCYVGTHDNETAVGWFADSANAQDKKYLKAYLGSDGGDIAWDFIRSAMASVSNTSIVMMQVRLGGVVPCICVRVEQQAVAVLLGRWQVFWPVCAGLVT